jgi:hypothetical protein
LGKKTVEHITVYCRAIKDKAQPSQIPEALLPTVAAAFYLELTLLDVALIMALFFSLEVTLSPLLFLLNIRKRPY